MAFITNLPEDKTAALTANARAKGLRAEAHAGQVIEQNALVWLQRSRPSTDEIDAEVAAGPRNAACVAFLEVDWTEVLLARNHVTTSCH